MDGAPVWNTGAVHNSRATLDKHSADVSQMFDGVAHRYDLMNDVLTLGIDRQWRRDVADALEAAPGQRVLDLAAGTGTSSVVIAESGAMVYPLDISLGMLQEGKLREPGLGFLAGDALHLPFADDVFDAVTISFGLRNVEDTLGALTEMLRVTKPGGRLVVCEFSTPARTWMRTLYRDGVLKALPQVARLSSNPPAYRYLVESIVTWPDQSHLADLVHEAGWRAVGWRNLSGGIVALHRAWKPGHAPVTPAQPTGSAEGAVATDDSSGETREDGDKA